MTPHFSSFSSFSLLSAVATAVLLASGCASVSPDGLRGEVQALTAGRTAGVKITLPAAHPGARAQEQAAITEALAQPLTLEAAVQIALLNNPGLQAKLAALGVADALRVQALSVPNPTVVFKRTVGGNDRELERKLAFNPLDLFKIIDIITLPWRADGENQQAELATLQVAQDVVTLAADTRRAWLRAVAAEQKAAIHGQVQNFHNLQSLREKMAQAKSKAQAARAKLHAAKSREVLTRLLGLSGEKTQYALADELPELPTTLESREGTEAKALEERLDLRAARQQLDTVSEAQGWVGVSAVFGNIGLAYAHTSSTDRASGGRESSRGWELELPLPLFDWGGTAQTKASAEVAQSAALLQEAVVRASSEVRLAWLTQHTAYDLARQQRDEITPLRQQMAEETARRYHNKQASTAALQAEARAHIAALGHAIEVQRDFWLADTDLQLALTGTTLGGQDKAKH